MTTFAGLQDGDRIRSRNDGMVLTVKIHRGVMYFAGNRDMWRATEFDPADWVVVKESST